MGGNGRCLKNMVLTIFMVALVVVQHQHGECKEQGDNVQEYSAPRTLRDGGFVRRSGTNFILHEKRFYFNGFNAYWLMYMASNPSTRYKVTTTLQQASHHGLNVARTWAFSDGPIYRAFQPSPGLYNEQVFRGLDFVISEARKYGVRLILSLVNNWKDFGGKYQYVQWAREHGHYVNNEDDFFAHPVVKQYYKNHIKAVLTRINTITGVAYKDEPIIFAWELMNEPRSQHDYSGKVIQVLFSYGRRTYRYYSSFNNLPHANSSSMYGILILEFDSKNSVIITDEWVTEMAAYVKSIDSNHLLEVGIEGFYGETMPEKKKFNPGYQLVGTDFISNNQVPQIDFATIHLYPEQWLPGSNEVAQAEFVDEWVKAHIEDSKNVLGKPIVVAEFGKSSRLSGYSVEERDSYFGKLYDLIYSSARSGGPCAGGLFWHLMAQGMDSFRDGYEVIFAECPSTTKIIHQQSQRMSSLA